MASNGFYTTDSCRHRSFAHDPEEADLAGSTDMGSAAEFHGVSVKIFRRPANLYNAYNIAVLIAEELQDARLSLDLGIGQLVPAHGGVLKDALIDQAFHAGDLIGSQSAA